MTDAAVLHTVPPDLRGKLPEKLAGRLDVAVAETAAETRDLLADAEVAVTGRFDAELLDDAPALRWLQAMSAGVDYLPQDALSEAGVALTSAAGVHAEPIGEQVLGYMLAFERDLHVAARNQARGVWERDHDAGELAGKTLGIVGLGAIGSRVAQLGQAFRMEVVGTKRTPEDAPEAADEAFGPDGLATVLRRSDYLVVACPLTDETRGLIGREELRTLGSDGVLVNVARGEVVDQEALVRALQYRTIRGAALDVFEEEPLPPDSPLWDLSNVVLTPHMAGSTPKYADRLADLFANNYDAYRSSGVDALENRVV
ncbi:MAG: D-2-hydroxyacid dehydrogenase [Halobacteriales archaeon]